MQLDALFIEGLVHVTELGADYFQYDEARHELRGERTGMRYQLTDRVTVQVSRVDLDARKIDLRLVSEPGIHTQLKNEARRADAEQESRKSKQGGKAQAARKCAGAGLRRPRRTRARPAAQERAAGAATPGLGANATSAPKARTSGKNAGDKSGRQEEAAKINEEQTDFRLSRRDRAPAP